MSNQTISGLPTIVTPSSAGMLWVGDPNASPQDRSWSVANIWAWILAKFFVQQKTVSVEQYGADGDGITDDTTAIQNALNTGYDVTFAKKSYLISSTLTISTAGQKVSFEAGCIILSSISAVTDIIAVTASDVVLEGKATIKLTGSPGNNLTGVVHVYGAVTATTTNLTANASPGDVSVAVTSATGFAAGNWIEISDTSYNYSKEYQQIKAVSGLTIYLDGPVCKPYATASTAKITKVTMVERVRIQDLSIDQNLQTITYGFLLEYCANCHLVGVQNRNYYYHGITVNHSSHVAISRPLCENGWNDFSTGIGAYGFTIGQMSGFVTVSGGVFRNLRETNVTEGAHHVTISGNALHGMYSVGIFTHGRACRDITIIGNTVSGLVVPGNGDYATTTNNKGIGGPFEDSGYPGYPDQRISIIGNTISNFWGPGIYASLITEASGAVTISGNTIYNCKGGIAVTKVDDVNITGNTVIRTDTDTTGFSTTGINVTSGKNVVISGNVIHWAATVTTTIYALFGQNLQNAAITGNSVTIDGGASATCYEIEVSTTSTNIRLTGNVHSGGSVSCHVDTGVTNVSASNNSFDTLSGSLVWDPPSISAGGTQTGAVTVTGAAVGDYAEIATPYTLQGLTLSCYVTGASTVGIVLTNPTGSPIDLGSGTWWVRVHKRYGS